MRKFLPAPVFSLDSCLMLPYSAIHQHRSVQPERPKRAVTTFDRLSRESRLCDCVAIIVAIGSQTRHGPNKSMCVCIPTRAILILKSAIVKTQARSAELFYHYPVTFDVGPTSIYKLCSPADCAKVNIAQWACLMTLATKLLREYDEKGPFW